MKTTSVSKSEFDEYKSMYLGGGVSIGYNYFIGIASDGTQYFFVGDRVRVFKSIDAFVRAAIIVIKSDKETTIEAMKMFNYLDQLIS